MTARSEDRSRLGLAVVAALGLGWSLLGVPLAGRWREVAPPGELPSAVVTSELSRSASSEVEWPRPRVLYAGAWRGTPWQVEFFPVFDRPLDLNLASEAELELLPGIGEQKARDLVRYREQHGSFRSLEQVTAVKGIGPKTVERWQGLVQLAPAPYPAEAAP